MITATRDFLTPQLGTRYVARVERRVYLEHETDDQTHFVPDLMVVPGSASGSGLSAMAVGTGLSPVECVLPMPEEHREAFLVIRSRERNEVVTVLEILSPANKRMGSDGRREYLNKRELTLRSRTHLLELDLLRGGERLPTVGQLPAGDFYAIVSRATRRPRADVYAWPLREPLPAIPVPLDDPDPDVTIDLALVFATVFERARYELSLNYESKLHPPLSEGDLAWAKERIAAARTDAGR